MNMNALMLAELLVTARKSELVKVLEALRTSPSLLRPTLSAYVTHVSSDRVAEDYRVENVGRFVGGVFPSRRNELSLLETDFSGEGHPQVQIFFDAVRKGTQASKPDNGAAGTVRRIRLTPQSASSAAG